MNKETLQNLIENGYSQRELATELNVSHSTIKYWLNKLELKTSKELFNKNNTDEKKCSRCKKDKNKKLFYNNCTFCKKCSHDYKIDKNRKRKISFINLFGGECKRCKLKLEDTIPSVFEFHHVDPKQKDPNIVGFVRKNINLTLEELKKCILVCANCHRVIHYEMNKI